MATAKPALQAQIRKWIEEKCPNSLLVKDPSTGLMVMRDELAQEMSELIRRSYNNQWTERTMDAAFDQIREHFLPGAKRMPTPSDAMKRNYGNDWNES